MRHLESRRASLVVLSRLPDNMNTAFLTLLRILLVGAGAVGFLFVGVVAAFWYFAPDLCGNEVIAEYPSPSARHRVVVFKRDCGATTGFSTHASILEVEEDLDNESGNVFASDANHGAAPAGPGGTPVLFVTWESESSVTFSYHPKIRVFKMRSEIDGVHVVYGEIAQPSARGDAEIPMRSWRD